MKLLRFLAVPTVLTVGLAGTAVVTATSSSALSAPRMTRTERSWATAVFTLLNDERAAHGRPPLRLNRALVRSARYHNERMARANTLSHQLPHEPSFTERERAFGYHWYTAAENCSVNPDVSLRGVLQLERMMYHEAPPGETGHRQNILSRSLRDVGIAVLVDPKNERVWMTEDFGARA